MSVPSVPFLLFPARGCLFVLPVREQLKGDDDRLSDAIASLEELAVIMQGYLDCGGMLGAPRPPVMDSPNAVWSDAGERLADTVERDNHGIGVERVTGRIDNPTVTLLALLENLMTAEGVGGRDWKNNLKLKPSRKAPR